MRFAVLLVTLLAAPAAADDAPVPIDHVGQLGVSLRLALGVRAIAPYDKTVYCGKTESDTSTGYAPVCVGRSPFVLDLEGSYGLKRRLDVFLELRLGI